MGFQQVSIVPKPGCLGYVGDEQPNVGSIYRYIYILIYFRSHEVRP